MQEEIEKLFNKKDPKRIGIGDLINELCLLNDEMKSHLVSEDYPYQEDYDKYGGINEYNSSVRKYFSHRRELIIKELNERDTRIIR